MENPWTLEHDSSFCPPQPRILPGAFLLPVTSSPSLLSLPLLTEPRRARLEPQRLPLLPSLKHQAQPVPFLTHRTSWGFVHFTGLPARRAERSFGQS